jgi:hypothetical protein
VDFAKSLREQAAAGQPRVIRVRITHEYFQVIEANLQNIGMLPVELPLLVPKFLSFAKSALEDVNDATEGGWNGRTPAELVASYDGMIGALEASIKVGREIVVLVAALYGSPHGRLPLRARLRRKLSRSSPLVDPSKDG